MRAALPTGAADVRDRLLPSPPGRLAASRDRQLRAIALPLSAPGGLPRRPATFAFLAIAS
ncbi:hypothetical protein SAMN05444359_1487 [Neolewinella agarilytica]|uniref:Uncharacterized protein n=1 Tax=Neolewinella agarilytica TaxID=478744 RepID=A0A1H9PF30_9BACT|nr:hypothetical protein SAMN05444359_1487 [Neolewinella agarilytica]